MTVWFRDGDPDIFNLGNCGACIRISQDNMKTIMPRYLGACGGEPVPDQVG